MPTSESALVDGVVIDWHDEDGWGVLRTEDGTEVWCHYSSIEVEQPMGYKTLRAGESVRFDYETPGQDGYPARVRSTVHRGG